jgi:hypothetical protein
VRAVTYALILLTSWHFSHAEETRYETVEEVVAVVGPTPILKSDLLLAELVGLGRGGTVDPTPDDGAEVLESRSRLELQFRDLEASGFLHRLELDPDTALDQLLAGVAEPDTLPSRLEPYGLTWDDVEELALRVAVVHAYVEQRLRPHVAVSLEEIETAYRAELAAELTAAGQPVPDLEQVREQLYRLLVERKLNLEIEGWLNEARERQEITRFVR